MRMVLGMIVGMLMGVMMNGQVGWNHGETLYYNITPVHCSAPRSEPVDAQAGTPAAG